MEIRYFQIIVPLIAAVFIVNEIRDFTRNRSGLYETISVVIFWLSGIALSLFPDLFSNLIADFFGIKSNINAIIFLALGILFYLHLKMQMALFSGIAIISDHLAIWMNEPFLQSLRTLQKQARYR